MVFGEPIVVPKVPEPEQVGHHHNYLFSSRRIVAWISANCRMDLGELSYGSRRISYQAREDELRAERRRASDALHAAAGAREREREEKKRTDEERELHRARYAFHIRKLPH